MSRSIETLSRRGKTRIQNLDRLQKPPVFHDESKIELKTSAMVFVPLAIQLYPETRSRKKHGEGRRTKQKARLARRGRKR